MPSRAGWLSLILLCVSAPALADAEGDALGERVASRRANEGRVGIMHFRLVNSGGKVREREALMAHSDRDDAVRIAIYFTGPAVIRDTAFLSHDYRVREDENWLYLPATERVRRLPVSDRGDYFMGTDLTYGDIKDDFKFGLDDWRFSHGGFREEGGQTYEVLLGEVATPKIARELGYSAFEAWIDPESAFPRVTRFADPEGAPLKVVTVEAVERIGGAWTALAFSVDQLQTGHRTEVSFENMRHVPDLSTAVFEAQRLSFGVPVIP
ncbi:MAG: outer membrane lipoprotein-sorting protein [Pseudomonadales bacterium]|jgi:hypothetical protein|nr:outer membrane lipoprotein-sorting protein [Pseudomonadales bacterium]